MVMFVVNLLYQRFGAILMSRHRFMKLFYLKNQAFSTVMLVGKVELLTFTMAKEKFGDLCNQ